MKALLCGDGQVRLADVPKPVPGPQEALIRVTMAGICNTDLEVLAGYREFSGILGHEFVGVVESDPLGELTGKRVVGSITVFCGKCWHCRCDETSLCLDRTTIGINERDGAFAEFIALPRQNLHVVPAELSDMEAVLIEPLAAGMRVAEQVHIRPVHTVVVLGDGKLGLLSAKVLSTTGCNVTVVGKHADKLSLASSMGLRTAILDDFTGPADVVLDCTGSVSGLETAIKLVRSGGTIVLKTTVAGKYNIDLSPIVVREIRVVGSRCGPFASTLALMERHNLDLSGMVEAVYPLIQGVEAFNHARRKGALKILLSI
ncbi:MAG: alcohol dehydrogenase catalytic domain-containing protein [Bacillota bacterium]|nr:alcohol dehydrogenase catalytic domain-containing protein [Bacillota bacterium]